MNIWSQSVWIGESYPKLSWSQIIITRWWWEEFTRVSYVYSSRFFVAEGVWGWLWDCILTYVVKMFDLKFNETCAEVKSITSTLITFECASCSFNGERASELKC